MNSSTGKRNPDTGQRACALFDLDGTLTTRDTFLPFLLSYAKHHGKWWPVVLTPFVVAAYLVKLVSDRTAKQILMKAYVGDEDELCVSARAADFFHHWVASRLHPIGLEKLREHQSAGDRVILVSASPDIYVPEIARQLGIEDVVCTSVRRQSGRVTGEIDGPNCKREAKVQLVCRYLNRRDAPAGSYGYGDSRHDLPLLRWVTHGYLLQDRRLRPVREIES